MHYIRAGGRWKGGIAGLEERLVMMKGYCSNFWIPAQNLKIYPVMGGGSILSWTVVLGRKEVGLGRFYGVFCI